MSKKTERSTGESEREELPIERGFPIELVNDLAEKEGYGGARQHYRPVYTMHKWWAPRTGAVFRTICLYSLLTDADDVRVREPGTDGERPAFVTDSDDVQELIDAVSTSEPDALWPLYSTDVTVDGKRVLDPFMGGGTSLVEAARFGADVTGNDLNPVAWFTVKKMFDAPETDVGRLEAAYEKVADRVGEEILEQYRTPCPNGDHEADVISYFWAKQLDCVSCGESVPLFNDYRVAKGRYENSGAYNVFCPECRSVTLVDDWRTAQDCSCGHSFVPENGTVSGSQYNCGRCGQRYDIMDAVAEQSGYDSILYAIEYYCERCDERSERAGYSRDEFKGYKSVTEGDLRAFEEARAEWDASDDLREYVPDVDLRPGWYTTSTEYDGSAPGAHDLPKHGIETWTDVFNERQLLCLSKLLRAIDELEDQNATEYLLLAFSDSLRLNSLLTIYHHSNNQAVGVFKTNSFDPPMRPIENNLWGTRYGSGAFTSMWEMVLKGVAYADSPTDRYIEYPPSAAPSPNAPVEESLEKPNVTETDEFATGLSGSADVYQGDMRRLNVEDEYDAVITDPPYYDNILYSELADYFYVWQRLLLKDEYDCFTDPYTPRAESIAANPAEDKGEREFEDEIKQAFDEIMDALTDDGVLAFTYHHSTADSWGEVLESLCEVGFEVTATYPVSADLSRLTKGESVNFDIIVVARPARERTPISWRQLRRTIYRAARRTRRELERSRELSRGDIGVIEMGQCFQAYSKHHGKVERDGERMGAKEVVDEIYGIIQEANEIGTIDVFVELLETDEPSFDDVNKLCRGTGASLDELKAMRLYTRDGEFELGTWDNETRQAYIQERVNGEGVDHLTALDKLQFLRYRYENGRPVQNYVDKWGVDDELHELAGRLADVTGDDTYARVLGDRDVTRYD